MIFIFLILKLISLNAFTIFLCLKNSITAPISPASVALVSPVVGRLGLGVSGVLDFSPYHLSLSPISFPEIAPLGKTVASSACVYPSKSLSSVPLASI